MSVASEIATSQAVWAILCIALAGFALREMRKDSVKRDSDIVVLYDKQKTDARQSFEEYREEARSREHRLMEHLEKSNASQEGTTQALEAINRTMITLEARMDRLERKNDIGGMSHE